MIKIIERERATLSMACMTCGYHSVPGAQDFCDECGSNKFYEFYCPVCKKLNLEATLILMTHNAFCVHCNSRVPNVARLIAHTPAARINYYLLEEINGQSIH
jgi:hypothetical protein